MKEIIVSSNNNFNIMNNETNFEDCYAFMDKVFLKFE
jgi:hypothetical protein